MEQTQPDGQREVVWGNRHVHQSVRYLLRLVNGGRLKANSLPMRRYLGVRHNQIGETFNNEVAELYQQFPGLIVRSKVTKIARKRIARENGQPLGDIDVLVADPARMTLSLTETKDLSVARNPADLSNEIAELFGDANTANCAASRHLERVAWIQSHLPEVLRWLRLEPAHCYAWKVVPLMVVDEDLISPRIVAPPFPVISLRDLSLHLRAINPSMETEQ